MVCVYTGILINYVDWRRCTIRQRDMSIYNIQISFTNSQRESKRERDIYTHTLAVYIYIYVCVYTHTLHLLSFIHLNGQCIDLRWMMMSRPYSTDAQLKDVLRVRKSTWGSCHFVCEKTKPQVGFVSKRITPKSHGKSHGLSWFIIISRFKCRFG